MCYTTVWLGLSNARSSRPSICAPGATSENRFMRPVYTGMSPCRRSRSRAAIMAGFLWAAAS